MIFRCRLYIAHGYQIHRSNFVPIAEANVVRLKGQISQFDRKGVSKGALTKRVLELELVLQVSVKADVFVL